MPFEVRGCGAGNHLLVTVSSRIQIHVDGLNYV